MAAGQGASLRVLMERMGHSSARAALIYQHATRAQVKPGPAALQSRTTAWYSGYAWGMALDQPTDVSVRQFVADSGSVTRGLRQGRAYTLTLNGEPLAKMIPIRRRRAVPKEEVLAIFATAPAINVSDLRADLDETVGQGLDDPYEGTGL